MGSESLSVWASEEESPSDLISYQIVGQDPIAGLLGGERDSLKPVKKRGPQYSEVKFGGAGGR